MTQRNVEPFLNHDQVGRSPDRSGAQGLTCSPATKPRIIGAITKCAAAFKNIVLKTKTGWVGGWGVGLYLAEVIGRGSLPSAPCRLRYTTPALISGGSELLWSKILIQLFLNFVATFDKSWWDNVTKWNAFRLSCYCADHSQLTQALSFNQHSAVWKEPVSKTPNVFNVSKKCLSSTEIKC